MPAALETKGLAGRLRKAGREDLADLLVTGEQTPPPEQPEAAAEPTPLAPHEQLAKSSRVRRADGSASESRMMPPKQQSARAEFDQLRRDIADERVKVRDLEAQLEAAKHEVESASCAISAGYAAESQRDVAQARKAEEAAIAKVKDLQHRLTGAEIRVERAQSEADTFALERARDLLAEREQPARTIALELSRAVGEVLKLHRAYVTERQTVDRLVAAVPGATPRADGPVPEHPWESALKDLERAYRQATKLEPPTPRWTGLQLREQQDNLSRFEKLRRRKRLTEDDQPRWIG